MQSSLARMMSDAVRSRYGLDDPPLVEGVARAARGVGRVDPRLGQCSRNDPEGQGCALIA